MYIIKMKNRECRVYSEVPSSIFSFILITRVAKLESYVKYVTTL